MKKSSAILLSIALAVIIATIGIAGETSKTSGDASVDVKSLWSEFANAAKSDKPQTQLDILERIISKSEAERLTWDFYEAWQKKVDVATGRNWKLYDTLSLDRDKAYAAYADPLLDVLSGKVGLDSVKTLRPRLEKAKNSGFYESGRFWGSCRGASVYGEALAGQIGNDYEFALWYLLGTEYGIDEAACRKADAICLAIAESSGERSLQTSFADFDRCARKTENLTSIGSRIDEFGRYSKKWSPFVAALMADECILSLKLDTLRMQKTASSEDFTRLRAQCSEFEKNRGTFKGNDKLVARQCLKARGIIECLDGKDLKLSSDSTSVTVYFRNIRQADLSLFYEEAGKSTELYSVTAENPVNSYYVLDSLVIPVPVKDDGKYVINAKAAPGNLNASCEINRYSISASFVKDAQGWTVYAADYDSGKPLEKYDLRLYEGKPESEAVALYGNFTQSRGLSLMPQSFAQKIVDNPRRSQYVKCSYIDDDGVLHCSSPARLSAVQEAGVDPGVKPNAVVLTDCGAYHRGEVVHCKTIVYSGVYASEMAVAAKNTAVTVTLYDVDGNAVASKTLKTNESGSAIVDFTVPQSIKGGRSRIAVTGAGGSELANSYITVDDYVLPDFECVFEKIDSLYFVGDSVTVRGCVKAYSGHRINVSRAYYSVAGMEGTQKTVLSSDGKFSIKVPTPKNRYWGTSMTLVVNASTGETLEFTKAIPIGRYLDFRVNLDNAVESSVESFVANAGGDADEHSSVLDASFARFRLEAYNADGVAQKLTAAYRVYRGKELIDSGSAVTPETLSIQFPDADGEYRIEFEASARDGSDKLIVKRVNWTVIKLQKGAKSLDADVENVFVPREDEGIGFDFAATRGPVWAVATLYGPQGQPLYCNLLHLEGRRAETGSVLSVNLPYSDDYPDFVRMRVFYFRHGSLYQWTHQYSRPAVEKSMELSWARFTDMAVPGSEYSFTLKANPGAEAAVAIFDKGTETIVPNFWDRVSGREYPFTMPYLCRATGEMSGTSCHYGLYSLTKTDKIRIRGTSPLMNTAAMSPEVVPYQLVEEKPALGMSSDELLPAGADVRVRSDFATTLCWQPQIKLPASGEAVVKFRTSDKTGTFVVNAFVHDKSMCNAVLRREMKVFLPVELSVAQPVILSEGDTYVAGVVLSSLNEAVSGTLSLDAGAAGRFSREVQLQRDSICTQAFNLKVPSDIQALPVKVTFVDKKKRFSDAVALSIPVRPAIQALTESHSTVLLDGDSRDEAMDALSAQFVNTSANGATVKETTVFSMVKEMLSQRLEPSGCSVLDLTDAVSSRLMFGSMEVKLLLEDLREFRNADGGYAWIKGMGSSPVVTATLLERCAKVAAVTGAGFLTDAEISAAVSYLDREILSDKWHYAKWCGWCQGINLNQYLYVRSFYPSVPVKADWDAEARNLFAKAVKEYLFPADARGLNGRVFDKALRLSTLENIYGLEGGRSLLKGWGLPSVSVRTVLQSLEADVESLKEYAVDHPSGGVYYPNLVMPYRGLLSDEAYCHSMLCDLMSNYDTHISDGIRLWLMLQKETQKWDANFAFASAVASVLRGSESLKRTSVLSMTKSYEKPYREIKAAGNGFSISRTFVRRDDSGKEIAIAQGDTLKAGDRIIAKYSITNAENRSFVRVCAPHFGCMRPVKQLSGMVGWWMRPMNWYGGVLAPQAYREVHSDRTIYWFDTYPEEKSTITEEYFVTQRGVFTSPVLEIESLYAPHYRANGGYEGGLIAE